VVARLAVEILPLADEPFDHAERNKQDQDQDTDEDDFSR
jgi:hypothetical protein